MADDLVFAKVGEPVTTPDGTVICYVKNDLYRLRVIKSGDFHQLSEGEIPWRYAEPFDARCVRRRPRDEPGYKDGYQICINGEWRP